MSSGRRIALLAVAVVILVAAFVVASGSDDDEGGSTPAAQSTTPAPASTGTGGSEAPAEKPAPRVERVQIRGGQPVGKPRKLVFQSGDTIRLRFTSDAPGEVHVHGYDKEVEVAPGQPGRLTFKAKAQGVFEIESHDTDALLATLEVRP